MNNIKTNPNKNSVKEIKDKKFKKESKIIKENIPKQNVNMNINNYTQINNNKKKKKKIILIIMIKIKSMRYLMINQIII